MSIGYSKENVSVGDVFKGKSGPDRKVLDIDATNHVTYQRRMKDGTFPPAGEGNKVCFWPSFCDWAVEKVL
jgi:hypothetical protein